jgi:hypothetical protein
LAQKSKREMDLEARVAELEAQITSGRPFEGVLPDHTNTGIPQTDADIIRERKAGRRMRTPAEVAELERQGIIIPPPGSRALAAAQVASGPKVKTGYTEDEKGNLVIGPTMEESAVPKGGLRQPKNVDNTGEVPVETDGVL